MCGIFGVVNEQNHQAPELVLSSLKKLEYRGYDSWGIASLTAGKDMIEIEKHVGKIGEGSTYLRNSNVAVGHTRWATHGGVTHENAHPHLDSEGQIAVVHNGIIENYKKLKSSLKKKGHEFKSETDTEVVAHLVKEYQDELSFREAVFKTFRVIKGSNAIVVLDKASQTIVACRDGSPLVLGVGDDEYYCASDVIAFLDRSKKAIFLKDQEGAVIKPEGIEVYDLKSGQEVKADIQTIEWEAEEAKKGHYPHFLIKEIFEQREVLEKITQINHEQLQEVAEAIKHSQWVYLTACGTAYHVCLLGQYFFARENQAVQPLLAHEAGPFIDFLQEKDVLVAVSQSGETADTLIASKAAKNNKALLAGVYNARGSTLERLVDYPLPIGAGPEIAVVSTKASTAQIATLFLLSKAVAGNFEQGLEELRAYVHKLAEWLNKDLEKQIRKLAKNLLNEEHIFLIGRGENYPASLEFALKIKESSYIHAEAFAASELKHGVISLIRQNTPCFCLASNDELRAEVLSSATEVKARGGKIYGVAPFEASEFDHFIKTPDGGRLTVIANIIVGQMLAYYLGVGRGADPDKPRNLAKSVTVK